MAPTYARCGVAPSVHNTSFHQHGCHLGKRSLSLVQVKVLNHIVRQAIVSAGMDPMHVSQMHGNGVASTPARYRTQQPVAFLDRPRSPAAGCGTSIHVSLRCTVPESLSSACNTTLNPVVSTNGHLSSCDESRPSAQKETGLLCNDLLCPTSHAFPPASPRAW